MSSLPLAPPTGDFTPGAQASIDAAYALINTAWEQANEKHTTFEAKIASAQNELPDISTTLAGGVDITAGTVADPSITEPAVTIPASINTTDVYSEFNTQYLELVALLSDKFALFRSTYFPDESASYGAAETWLTDALANPDAGIPATVAAQLLDDDRSRILADANRASDAVMATFAAKRLPLPPGAAASAVVQIEQKANEEISATSRKLVVASIEQMKFAIEKTLSLRQLAMGSAVEYIKALASGPDMASRLVNIGYDAQSKLIGAASQFYNSRISAAEAVAKVRQFNVSSALQADEKNQAVDVSLIEAKIKTLLAEAQALAQMATSMYNNLHASASTSYSGSQASTV